MIQGKVFREKPDHLSELLIQIIGLLLYTKHCWGYRGEEDMVPVLW